MKRKKFLAFSLAVALLAGSALSVSAAGVEDVFDASYYAGQYSDLKAAYGTNEEALLEHFLTNGAKEGRTMSPILDVVAYRNAYADLNAAFGDDWDAYVDHFLTYGIKEKRMTGVLFDLADYASKNPDVKAAFGEDYAAIAQHYIDYGRKEGRPGGSIQTAAPAVKNNSGSKPTTPPTTPPATEQPTTPPATEQPTDHVSHSKGELKSELNPTCTEAGYREWLCKEKLLKNKYDADGNWIGTEPVIVDGHEVYCDVIWRETLPAQHVAPETGNMYIKHATCTDDGLMRYTCTRCGQHVDQVVPKLKHELDPNPIKSVGSKSCKLEDRGYDIYQCKNCHKYTEKKDRAPLDHKMAGQPNVVKAATCTTKGQAYGHCDTCGKEVYVDLPMTAHATKTVTAYADTYLRNTAMTHKSYQVTYCKDCREITAVGLLSGDVNCADANGDGNCDGCGLRMDRNVTSQEKIYSVGETYFANVQ